MLIISFFIALFVKYYTRVISFNLHDYQINNAKKSAIQSLIIITVIITMGTVFILSAEKLYRYVSEIGILLIQSSILIFFTAIVIWVVLHKKESFQSIGITKVNLFKSFILGILLGVIYFAIYQITSNTNKVINIISVASLISFIEFLIVGFTEEIIFRGYLQRRLIAWKGTYKGCFITAIIFSLFHIPQNMVVGGISLQSALLNCCYGYIPLSLLLGYIMIKTKNIISVSIFHTLIDWTNFL